MSGYIVDPMWFYWLQVCGFLNGAFTFAGACGVILFLVIGSGVVFFSYDELIEETAKKIARTVKIGSIISIIALIVGMLIPSEETLIKMEIAKNATYENVEIVMEEITNAADYIIGELKED